jgi:hypothetical protein
MAARRRPALRTALRANSSSVKNADSSNFQLSGLAERQEESEQ